VTKRRETGEAVLLLLYGHTAVEGTPSPTLPDQCEETNSKSRVGYSVFSYSFLEQAFVVVALKKETVSAMVVVNKMDPTTTSLPNVNVVMVVESIEPHIPSSTTPYLCSG
jgi:hypothetical protein